MFPHIPFIGMSCLAKNAFQLDFPPGVIDNISKVAEDKRESLVGEHVFESNPLTNR